MAVTEVGNKLAAVIVDTQITTLVQADDMRHGVYEVVFGQLALCPLTGTREGRVPSTGGCTGQEEEGHTNNAHCKLRWSWAGLTRKLM